MLVTLDIWFLIAPGLFILPLGAAPGISAVRSLQS